MSGDRANILPFEATETTLANGLRVIVVPTGFPNLVSLQIPVQTGSRNEVEPGKSGFAHFFETCHVSWHGALLLRGVPGDRDADRGAPKRLHNGRLHELPHDVRQGGPRDRTRTRGGPVHEPSVLRRRTSRPKRGPSSGEYNKNSADPLNKLIEVQRDSAYTTHTYKHTTMGFIRDIEDMPNQFEYSRAFFDRWYRPEYTTVIVAGDVDPAATLALVEKLLGCLEIRQRGGDDHPARAAGGGPRRCARPMGNIHTSLGDGCLSRPGVFYCRKGYAALDTLLDLWFGETSELYQKLVEREQMVDQLFPYNPSQQDPGLATVMARVKRLEDTVEVRDAILETIARARTRTGNAGTARGGEIEFTLRLRPHPRQF